MRKTVHTMTPSVDASQTKRDALVSCARDLFAREGFHATGVDRILARAGVAKMTLYNHFGSKEQLIVAVLDRESRCLLDQMRSWIARSEDPFEQVLLLFDGLGAWFEAPERCGCLIQAAAAEFSDPGSPVGRAVLQHQARVQGLLAEITGASECPDAPGLAGRIGLLLAGAMSSARIVRSRAPADEARKAAAVLLEDACRRAELRLE